MTERPFLRSPDIGPHGVELQALFQDFQRRGLWRRDEVSEVLQAAAADGLGIADLSAHPELARCQGDRFGLWAVSPELRDAVLTYLEREYPLADVLPTQKWIRPAVVVPEPAKPTEVKIQQPAITQPISGLLDLDEAAREAERERRRNRGSAIPLQQPIVPDVRQSKPVDKIVAVARIPTPRPEPTREEQAQRPSLHELRRPRLGMLPTEDDTAAGYDAIVSGRVNRERKTADRLRTAAAKEERAPKREFASVVEQITQAREHLVAIGRETAAVRKLHDHQNQFIDKFDEYFLRVTDPDHSKHVDAGEQRLSRMARIEAAPRTGKTTVAAEIIRRTNLRSVFYVPAKNLVPQVAKEFRALLPDKQIAMFSGEEKGDIDNADVIVTTYQIGQHRRRGAAGLPETFGKVPLVFADEGHESTTEDRMELMEKSYDDEVIRVALSGTPDYDEGRKLEHHYPTLIDKISTPDAVELDLYAPFQYFIYEIDIDASRVNIDISKYGPEFNPDDIEKIMNRMPVNRLITQLRTLPENRDTPGLVTVTRKRQAAEVADMLREAGFRVAVVVEDTPDQKAILDAYEAGDFDTLVTVGVLLRGWDSPRCKLLIDAAPGIRPVRAGQKFTRPMTKVGESVASLYCIIPKNLPVDPLIPPQVLLNPDTPLPPGRVKRAKKPEGEAKPLPDDEMPIVKQAPIIVDGVHAKPIYSLREFGGLQKLQFEKTNIPLLREVIKTGIVQSTEDDEVTTGKQFMEYIADYQAFQRTFFNHPQFRGLGRGLLLGLDVRDEATFQKTMNQLFPKEMADILLMRDELNVWSQRYGERRQATLQRIQDRDSLAKTSRDQAHLAQAIAETANPDRASKALRYLDLYMADPEAVDETALAQQMRELFIESRVSVLLERLSERCAYVLRERFLADKSLREVGAVMGLSTERVRQIQREGLSRLANELHIDLEDKD